MFGFALPGSGSTGGREPEAGVGVRGGGTADAPASAGGEAGAAPKGGRTLSFTFCGAGTASDASRAGVKGGGGDSAAEPEGTSGEAGKGDGEESETAGGASDAGAGSAPAWAVWSGEIEILRFIRIRSPAGAPASPAPADVAFVGGGSAGAGALAAAAASSANESRGLIRSGLASGSAAGGVAGAGGGGGAAAASGGWAGGVAGGWARGLNRNGGGVDSSLMRNAAKHLPTIHETKKIHSRSERASFTLLSIMTKLKLALLAGLAAGLLLADGGCLFWRKSKKPKEDSAIAAATAADLHTRFMDKRTAELVAQGKDAASAKQQAEAEFQAKYPYLKGASQK